MTISIEAYRNSIGKFNLSGRNSQFKFKNRNIEKKSFGRFSMFSKLLVILLVLTRSCKLEQVADKTDNFSFKCNPSSYSPSLYNHPGTLTITTIKLVDFMQAIPRHVLTVNWSHRNKPNNKLGHALHGNRRIGYKIGFWNCRKKLISQTEFDTNKLTDIKTFFEEHNPHIFGIIESNIYGLNSPLQNKKFSTEDVKSKLHIEGYQIIFPTTWSCHGQARVLAYVRDDIKANIVKEDLANSDLPSISLEVGIGCEKKTLVNLFYR